MYKSVCLFGALLCSGFLYAQEAKNKVESLEEVVLIDSKFKLNREKSGKVVTTITPEELENSKGQTLPEVINRVSGIEINGTRSNDGQNLGYYVRGGRNRQVVIMVDGVQLNDASSIANDFDLRLLALDQVESIEIIKGASSTLYGSGAAAAVISIITKQPVDRSIGLQIQSVLGTNQTQRNQDYDIAQFDNSVTLSGKQSKFDYQVTFSSRYSENMSSVKSGEEGERFDDNPFNKYNLYTRLGYRINDNIKFHVFGNFDKFNSSYDNAFMYEDEDNRLVSDQFRVGSRWEASYKNGSFNFSDSYTIMNRDIQSDFPNAFDSKIYTFDAHNKYIINDRFHTVLGLNGNFSSFNSFSTPFGEESMQQVVSDDVANFNIIDPYFNLVYISEIGFNMNMGTRLNMHSEYGTTWVYNINPSYTLSLENGYVKALTSYSTAFITPSLYQLYDGAYGNTDLRPEESHTMEGGFEYKQGKFRLSGIYFERNSNNFVDFVIIDPENLLYRYENIAEEFKAKGVEVELNVEIAEGLNFSGNYTFTEADERFALRIPKHKVNSTLGYRIDEKTFTSITYQFNDDRRDTFYNSETFANEQVVLDKYGIVDLYFSRDITSNFKLFAGVNNLTNANYEELYRFNTRGRNVRFGFSLSI
ncbi:MAG TPA: TonB-dependent receptor [Gillisia sp.]|nr:TonB-dependent receptor [Gillisia sp.]